jgi:hypothetical protein
MSLIADIARYFGVKPLFVPQVLNFAPSNLNHRWAWVPFLRTRDLPHLMQEMNKDTEQAARESGAVFIGASLAPNWTEADFYDDAHFNAAGSEKLARAIAGDVAANCR